MALPSTGWTRRTWLKLAAGVVAIGAAGGAALNADRVRRWVAPLSGADRRIVSRIVDLLVPRDEGPGALDLGLDREILQWIESRRREARSVSAACAWIEAEARSAHGKPFLDLGPASQEALVSAMERAAHGSVPNRAFRALRDRTLEAYYTRPEGWSALDYRGPPQPEGYMDYADPPDGRPS